MVAYLTVVRKRTQGVLFLTVDVIQEQFLRHSETTAKDLGLNTFGSRSEEYEYLYREVEDCNLGDLDFLIFTTLEEVDQVMTVAFDREEEEEG